MELAAVILAAGKGTRMNSSIPKVLHQIAGMPMLGHVLQLTKSLKIQNTSVIVGHGSDAVSNFIRRNKINATCINQKEQLGTGNALKCAQETLNTFDGNLIVLYGDVPFIKSSTIVSMLDQLEKGADLSILGFTTPDPANYGRLIIGAGNEINEIVEAKDCSSSQKEIKMCNAGIYCGSSKLIFSLLSKLTNQNASNEFYLTDIVKVAKKDGLKSCLLESSYFETQGINSRLDLANAELYCQEQLRKRALDNGVTLIDPKTIYLSHDTVIEQDTIIQPNVIFGPSVQIGPNVEILSFSHLEGCTIATGSKIGPFARVRPGTRIEENVKIGNFVEIKKSVLKKGSKANHLSYIGDAQVGSESNIGAGTVFCNYDGVSKHFTEIGENAFIGSNSSLVAPLKIGSNTIIGSGSVITKDVPSNALAISRTAQKNKKTLGKRLIEKLKSLKK
jgi:bifunctional UDP-N-acetylglucosamine pyrophosphorylase/glucosamine-1-phosphate N-acetyltransferase